MDIKIGFIFLISSVSVAYAAEQAPPKIPKQAWGASMTTEQRRLVLLDQARNRSMKLRGGSFYVSGEEIDAINARAAKSPGGTAPTFGFEGEKKE